MFSFREEILRLIALRQEGEYWDFKKEWHKSKPDLLHDIICMANNLSNHDGLIIIGVDEETEYSICDVVNDQNRKKTQDIVAFLREKKFAGGIRPTVYVQPLSLKQTTIDVIVICNDRNTPYFLTEHYQGVFANNIYARIMDTNTPKNATADINVISYQRFHINGIKHFVLGFAAQSQRRVRRFVPLGSKVGYRGFIQVKILDVSVAEGFLNGFDGIFSHP